MQDWWTFTRVFEQSLWAVIVVAGFSLGLLVGAAARPTFAPLRAEGPPALPGRGPMRCKACTQVWLSEKNFHDRRGAKVKYPLTVKGGLYEGEPGTPCATVVVGGPHLPLPSCFACF